jgi:hypothetical protein
MAGVGLTAEGDDIARTLAAAFGNGPFFSDKDAALPLRQLDDAADVAPRKIDPVDFGGELPCQAHTHPAGDIATAVPERNPVRCSVELGPLWAYDRR